MTDLPIRSPITGTALVVGVTIVSLGLVWLDWSRREPQLQARTADRLR